MYRRAAPLFGACESQGLHLARDEGVGSRESSTSRIVEAENEARRHHGCDQQFKEGVEGDVPQAYLPDGRAVGEMRLLLKNCVVQHGKAETEYEIGK